MNTHLPQGYERRRRSDFWVRSLEGFILAGWLLMLGAMLVLSKAKPEVETFFDRYYNIPLRSTWDVELLGYLKLIMILGLVVGLVGMLVNWRRGRRETDEVRISFFLVVVLSLAGLLIPYLPF